MEGDGEKAMDTNTRGSPGYRTCPNSLETQVVRKCGDIGHQRPVGTVIRHDTIHLFAVFA